MAVKYIRSVSPPGVMERSDWDKQSADHKHNQRHWLGHEYRRIEQREVVYAEAFAPARRVDERTGRRDQDHGPEQGCAVGRPTQTHLRQECRTYWTFR